MLRDIAVERIQAGIGFRTDLSATIVLRLQEAQDELEHGKTLPRFLIEEDATLTLTVATNSVSLPTGFLREVDDELPRYTQSGATTPTFIKRKYFPDAREAYELDETGGPKVYSLRKSSLYFFPTADQTYSLTWSYYKKADPLTTNVENAWLAADVGKWLLIGEAGFRVAKDLRDQSAQDLFNDMRARARAALYGDVVLDEFSAGPIALGEGL